MSDTKLADDLRRLTKLKEQRDAARRKYEELDQEFRQFQFRVMQRMREEEVGSTRVDGRLYTPKETIYAQVQDRQAFVRWALENDDELLEERERKELLNSLVRQRLDDGEALPPGVSFYVREYISQQA